MIVVVSDKTNGEPIEPSRAIVVRTNPMTGGTIADIQPKLHRPDQNAFVKPFKQAVHPKKDTHRASKDRAASAGVQSRCQAMSPMPNRGTHSQQTTQAAQPTRTPTTSQMHHAAARADAAVLGSSPAGRRKKAPPRNSPSQRRQVLGRQAPRRAARSQTPSGRRCEEQPSQTRPQAMHRLWPVYRVAQEVGTRLG